MEQCHLFALFIRPRQPSTTLNEGSAASLRSKLSKVGVGLQEEIQGGIPIRTKSNFLTIEKYLKSDFLSIEKYLKSTLRKAKISLSLQLLLSQLLAAKPVTSPPETSGKEDPWKPASELVLQMELAFFPPPPPSPPPFSQSD